MEEASQPLKQTKEPHDCRCDVPKRLLALVTIDAIMEIAEVILMDHHLPTPSLINPPVADPKTAPTSMRETTSSFPTVVR